ESGHEIGCRSVGSNVQHTATGVRRLKRSGVEAGPWFLAHRPVLDVAGNADDLENNFGTRVLERSTDGRAVRPVPPSHRLVDDRNPWPAGDVSGIDEPAADKTDLERIEVPRRHGVEIDLHVFA